MGTLVMMVAGTAAIAGGLTRLVLARRNLTPATVHLCVAVVAVGFSAALSAPAVLAVAAHVEPVPNLSRMLVNEAGMVAAWCVHSLLIHLVTEDETRARSAVRVQAAILLATLTAMTALFLLADTTYRPDFLAAFARLPEIFGYLLLFSGYVAWSLARFVLLMGRYVELTDRRWLQRGLRVMQTGAAFGLAWSLHKIVAATAVFVTGSSYPGAEFLASALPAACVTAVAVGLLLPVCAPPLARRVVELTRLWRYRRLRGLWETLSPVITKIRTTEPPATTTAYERLSTRVVDILDALLVLSPYRDGTTSSRTAADAAREAEAVVHALARWSAGTEPVREQPTGPASTTDVDDLDGEAAWLCRVAKAMRQLPAPPSPDTTTSSTTS
ncbi:MAB_1171c family putative transporter [Saccharomonospora glauca]|uniref:DUF6545 domain-containing protein n=1 Tax=Saccharomonospora glauca K62 TaxID=928724 RepID=I1D4P0_9PSEU|nr:MAB_1171c family putative transporter [Saccharomonospora glauca]EIE99914.1 hypothetical protein SacglDRAFT_03048 [Saccharomonospora glauca K62]